MKNTDLRIGNYVQAEWDNKYSAEVTAVNKSTAWIELQGELEEDLSRCLEMPFDYIFAIALNEEWLKRFGFKRHIGWDDQEYWIKDSLSEFQIWENMQGYEYDFTNIKHVHQLQNLYHALTGEEL